MLKILDALEEYNSSNQEEVAENLSFKNQAGCSFQPNFAVEQKLCSIIIITITTIGRKSNIIQQSFDFIVLIPETKKQVIANYRNCSCFLSFNFFMRQLADNSNFRKLSIEVILNQITPSQSFISFSALHTIACFSLVKINQPNQNFKHFKMIAIMSDNTNSDQLFVTH